MRDGGGGGGGVCMWRVGGYMSVCLCSCWREPGVVKILCDSYFKCDSIQLLLSISMCVNVIEW